MPRVDQRRREPEPSRRERLAINLVDITDERRLPESVRLAMRLHELLCHEPFQVDSERFDEVAVEFKCDLLRAACICDVVRNHDRKASIYPTRLYMLRQRVWSKLPGDAILTVIDDALVELNTRWFAPLAHQIVPLPYKKVVF